MASVGNQIGVGKESGESSTDCFVTPDGLTLEKISISSRMLRERKWF